MRVRAGVRVLDLDNLSRNGFEVRRGDDRMRLIERSWPDLARVFQAWSRPYATAVIDVEPQTASRDSYSRSTTLR